MRQSWFDEMGPGADQSTPPFSISTVRFRKENCRFPPECLGARCVRGAKTGSGGSGWTAKAASGSARAGNLLAYAPAEGQLSAARKLGDRDVARERDGSSRL